ncbi:hypothetical protein AVEN_112040-1, partial [Araneus ventricosus]
LKVDNNPSVTDSKNKQSVYGPDGKRTYPQKSNGDEYYLQFEGEDVILETTQGGVVGTRDVKIVKRYAKDASDNEFYPKDARGNPKYIESTYAIDSGGKPIFPETKDGDQFYLIGGDGSSIIEWADHSLNEYAKKKSGDEIYPTRYFEILESYKEVIVDFKYAKLSNNQPYYPLDEFGNEYTLNIYRNSQIAEPLSYPNGYPITNDNFIIVPNVDKKPYFLKHTNPKVEKENILGKIYSVIYGYNNYLTNVKATRKSRSSPKDYDYLPTGKVEKVKRRPISENRNSFIWLMIVLFVISMVFILAFKL